MTRERLRAAWGGWPGRIARVLIALLPLWWLSKRLDWRDVAAHARQVGPWPLAGACLAMFMSNLIGSFRWQIMLRAYGAPRVPSVLELLRHNLIGGYFNVLPSGVAGDAVRGARVYRFLPSLTASYVVVFVERICGLVGLCLIAATAMATTRELRSDVVAVTLELGLLGALGLASVVLLLPFAMDRRPSLRARLLAVPLLGAVLSRIPVARSGARLALAVGLSVFTQGSMIAATALVLRPLAPEVSVLTCARIVPAVILFTYIPLTPGGLGQREAAYVYLFGLAGVAASVATTASLLVFAAVMVLAGIGGLCLLAERVFDLDRSGAHRW